MGEGQGEGKKVEREAFGCEEGPRGDYKESQGAEGKGRSQAQRFRGFQLPLQSCLQRLKRAYKQEGVCEEEALRIKIAQVRTRGMVNAYTEEATDAMMGITKCISYFGTHK